MTAKHHGTLGSSDAQWLGHLLALLHDDALAVTWLALKRGGGSLP